jgi:hypothetical protein
LFSYCFTCITPGAFLSRFFFPKFQYITFTIIRIPKPSQHVLILIAYSTSTKRFNLQLHHLVYFLVISKYNTTTRSFSNSKPFQNVLTKKLTISPLELQVGRYEGHTVFTDMIWPTNWYLHQRQIFNYLSNLSNITY